MGVAGSGKTTVGTLLAERSARAFADADDFHCASARASMAMGIPLDDATRGPWLARLAEWLRAQPAPGGVLACSALKRRYRDVLRSPGVSVTFLHLAVPVDIARSRVGLRPAHFMPATLIDSQFEALEPLDHDEPGCTIEATLRTREIVREFLRRDQWSGAAHACR
jgi:gluconokinase